MTAHFVSLAKWPPFTSRLRGLIAQQVPGLIFAVGCWQAAHHPPPCISVRESTLLCSILSSVLARHRTSRHFSTAHSFTSQRVCEGDEKGMSMKGSSYRERDYAFGQVMLTLRTRLELTQTELAGILGVRRRAVIDWEGGLTYPKADHLKQFVVLAIERQAWPFGREAEEVRALWQAARQKVLLDDAWLGGLLSHIQAPPASQPAEETSVSAPPPHALASPYSGGPPCPCGDAPAGSSSPGP